MKTGSGASRELSPVISPEKKDFMIIIFPLMCFTAFILVVAQNKRPFYCANGLKYFCKKCPHNSNCYLRNFSCFNDSIKFFDGCLDNQSDYDEYMSIYSRFIYYYGEDQNFTSISDFFPSIPFEKLKKIIESVGEFVIHDDMKVSYIKPVKIWHCGLLTILLICIYIVFNQVFALFG